MRLDDSDVGSRLALEELCRTYWPAVNAMVRRRGFSPQDAEDLSQGFFTFVIENKAFSKADKNRGRFRTFLKTALNNYLANEWDRRSAKKRGGGAPHIRLDDVPFIVESPQNRHQPDHEFDRVWGLTLLSRALGRLEAEYEKRGRGRVFAALKPVLTGEGIERTYREIGEELSISETAVKLTVHRMRVRYQEILREETAQTVSSPEEAQQELDDLRAIFRESG